MKKTLSFTYKLAAFNMGILIFFGSATIVEAIGLAVMALVFLNLDTD